MCHNSFNQSPYCWTHSSFSYFNIYLFDCGLAQEPLGLLIPWLIFISHTFCLPYLSPLLPHNTLWDLNEACALKPFVWCRSGSPRKGWLNLHSRKHRRWGLAPRRKVPWSVGREWPRVLSLASPWKGAPETHPREQVSGIGQAKSKVYR